MDGDVRCFDKKQICINFKATSYVHMIEWCKGNVTPPPLLADFDSETLSARQQIILTYYPCHSQDVERNVKDVSVACSRVYGHSSRHGIILQMKKSRLEMPTVDTKANFQ